MQWTVEIARNLWPHCSQTLAPEGWTNLHSGQRRIVGRFGSLLDFRLSNEPPGFLPSSS
jgi:hypothetical protein